MDTKKKLFDFGEVRICKNIVIAEMKEGIIFNQTYNDELLTYCKQYFKNKPYAYISHRLNSYSIDPIVYIDAASNSLIRAIAIVSKDPEKRRNLEVEKQFFDHPFESFDSLNEAKKWVSKVLPYQE